MTARRDFDAKTREIAKYYKTFRDLSSRVRRALERLRGIIPSDELARLIRETDPARTGYRIESTCRATQRAAEIVEDNYQKEKAESTVKADTAKGTTPAKPVTFLTSRSDNETVSQFIDRVCTERSWKISDLAAKTGVHETQIYRIKKEEGVNSATLISVADALGCLVDDLLPRSPIVKPPTP
jgi:DNA-binding Xre family transcriptional regulator